MRTFTDGGSFLGLEKRDGKILYMSDGLAYSHDPYSIPYKNFSYPTVFLYSGFNKDISEKKESTTPRRVCCQMC